VNLLSDEEITLNNETDL